MYGFGALTGIEINENVSVISEDLPVTSAIGQGTHAFTTISLARYVTAIASRGNVYDFKLLREIRDRDDNILLSCICQHAEDPFPETVRREQELNSYADDGDRKKAQEGTS